MRGKFVWLTLLFVVSFNASLWGADQFDRSYFSALKGCWVGAGESINSDGETVTVHEEWSAEQDGERFLIRGTRLSGKETQEFHWTFIFNASTDFFECEYWHTGMDEELTFEVSLNDNHAELRTPFGDGGGELLVANDMSGNSIKSKVTITSGSGETFEIASLKHTKKEG